MLDETLNQVQVQQAKLSSVYRAEWGAQAIHDGKLSTKCLTNTEPNAWASVRVPDGTPVRDGTAQPQLAKIRLRKNKAERALDSHMVC